MKSNTSVRDHWNMLAIIDRRGDTSTSTSARVEVDAE